MSRKSRPTPPAPPPELTPANTIGSLASDPFAIAAGHQAVAHILASDERAAYVACRLACPAILARHPEIGVSAQGLALFLLRTAADAALGMVPATIRKTP